MARRMAILALALVAAAAALVGTPPSVAVAACEGEDCGAPSCWSADLRVRPGMARQLRISCYRATAATVKQQPEHGTVSDVSADWSGLRFTVLADEDAPRSDFAILAVAGPERSADVRVDLTVVPRSENSPPVCDGDRKTQRSDGHGPVDVFLHPYCRDPDQDEFVIEGGGPGTHPEAPKSVPSGTGDSNWPYRTATSSGTETATIWATDALGARSADAQLEVTVGPGVNRLPTCRPNPSGWTADGVETVLSRPGATRRFGVICEDPDADPFDARLSSPPTRGTLALVQGEPSHGFWGVERWIDATYAPAGAGDERDEFAITAGDGPAGRMAIVPRELPANSGGGCGWSGARIAVGTAGTVSASCSDDDGDPLTVEVLGTPLHGTAGPGAVVPGPYGTSQITVPYVPEPGFEGYDCVQILVSDGHGLEFKLTLDVWVVPASELAPATPPTAPIQLPPTTIPILGSPLRAGPPNPWAMLALARQVVGTRAVKVPGPAGAQVHAAPQLSRRELLRTGRAAGMVVACPAGCTVRADAELRTSRRTRARPSRTRTAVEVPPGHAQPVWVKVRREDRARLRRARSPRASFRVDVRPRTGSRRVVRRSIRIGA